LTGARGVGYRASAKPRHLSATSRRRSEGPVLSAL
jgi:hypothetical protein